MKKIFTILALAATLASCAKEDIISIDRQEIAFGDTFVDNATRADYSTGSLEEFYVYGTVTGTAGTVNIFDGDKVTKEKKADSDIGDTGTWWYAAADAQYWIPGADYDFAAIVDATVATEDTNGMPLTLTTQADSAMNLKDMLYATATATVNENGTPSANPVAFTFAHLLSKAHFTVTSNATGGYYHTVTGIKIANFESGTYTIANDSWAGGDAKDVVFAEIANVTSADAKGKSNAAMLLVPNADTFNVTFTVELWNNKGNDDATDDVKLGTETITKAVETDLLKGNAYNFTIDCKVGNPITFSVTNSGDIGWATQPDIPIQ